ncbi:MAG TPA: alpha/beta fold hydrolase [Polyangiales bacterium]
MRSSKQLVWVIVALSAGLWGCGSDSKSSSGPNGGNAATDGGGVADGGDAGGLATGVASTLKCDVVVSDKDCDKTKRPIVFVHGTYAEGDTFARVASLLGSNGYCQDRIIGVEYNSIFVDNPGNSCSDASPKVGCGKIDAAIKQILAANPGFTQVDLAGHSQGTSHCGTYLSVPSQAAKVAHYINLSGAHDVKDVETLSLSSMHDLGNTPHHATSSTDPTKVKTVTFTDEDHFAVADSKRSFIEIYKFLNGGKAPKYDEVQCGDEMITVEGISETFADNQPITGKLEIHEVGTEARKLGTAVTVGKSDAPGHFGPLQLKRGVPYVFSGYDNNNKLVGYAYYTPFVRSNYLMRLLAPASKSDGTAVGGLVAMQTTDKATRDAKSVTAVVRWTGGGFRQDLGASLKVDGKEVLTSANAGVEGYKTMNLSGGVAAMFLEDKNKNGKSDLGLVDNATFIAFSDVAMDATKPALIDFDFIAGSEDSAAAPGKITISNWPSSDVLVNVYFQ